MYGLIFLILAEKSSHRITKNNIYWQHINPRSIAKRTRVWARFAFTSFIMRNPFADFCKQICHNSLLKNDWLNIFICIYRNSFNASFFKLYWSPYCFTRNYICVETNYCFGFHRRFYFKNLYHRPNLFLTRAVIPCFIMK